MITEVIKANIEVHTRMANDYDTNEPQFRPENQAKVRGVLQSLQISGGGGKLLDLGCGTGFIINLAKDLFDEIHGVDITQAMLERVDTSSGNIRLHHTVAENLPFEDNMFDVVTSYAFLHHLEDYKKILAEAFRVLKPGGKFYSDLDPNKFFWDRMAELEKSPTADLSDIVVREIEAVLHNDAKVESQFGISQEVFQQAEYTKSILGGIDPVKFLSESRQIGFTQGQVRYEWFLGQGAVMHGQSVEAASLVEAYLRRILPLSAHVFKYLQFILVK